MLKANRRALPWMWILFLGCTEASGPPPTLRPEEAANHVGDLVHIEGEVAQVSELNSGTTFLNFGDRYPRQVLQAVVFASRRPEFPDLTGLEGQVVRVTGAVREYKGRMEIVLDRSDQLELPRQKAAGRDNPSPVSPLQASSRVPDKALYFQGGAGQVAGSLTIVSLDSGRYVVDAGAYYDDEAESVLAERRDAVAESRELPLAGSEIAAVFITHAHADHLGRLPLLDRGGFSGPIYSTAATARLAQQAVATSIRYEAGRRRSWAWSTASPERRAEKVHWNPSCQWMNAIRPANRRGFVGTLPELEERLRANGAGPVSPCRVCAELEAIPILERFVALDLGRTTPIAPDLEVTALPAGHIPGAVSLIFSVQEGGKKQQIAFSGDLGGENSTFVEPPQALPPVDAVLVETTYGRETETTPGIEEGPRDAFRRDLSRVIAAGMTAWIPAFALDRTQQVLVEIRQMIDARLLPEALQVCVVSPEALGYTETYRDPGFSTFLKPGSQRRIFGDFRTSIDERSPCRVVVSSSGMMNLGMSSGLLSRFGPREDVQIFLIGYQAPNTPGGQLEACSYTGTSPCEVRYTGEGEARTIRVAARAKKYEGFSAHARPREIDRWLSLQDKATTRLFLVHGDPEALEARRLDLLTKGWSHAHVPEAGGSWPLEQIPTEPN